MVRELVRVCICELLATETLHLLYTLWSCCQPRVCHSISTHPLLLPGKHHYVTMSVYSQATPKEQGWCSVYHVNILPTEYSSSWYIASQFNTAENTIATVQPCDCTAHDSMTNNYSENMLAR